MNSSRFVGVPWETLQCLARSLRTGRTMTNLVPLTILASLVGGAGCSSATPPTDGTEAVATSQSALKTSLPGMGSGVLWRSSNNLLQLWDMATPNNFDQYTLATLDPNWQVVGTGDFNH